jgi:hypothetical protein
MSHLQDCRWYLLSVTSVDTVVVLARCWGDLSQGGLDRSHFWIKSGDNLSLWVSVIHLL